MEWNNKVAAMHGLEIAFPFLDRDLISFLMAIPGEVQHQHGVPKAILREAVRDILPDAIANRTWKADFTDFVNEGLVRDYPSLVSLLTSDAATIRLGYSDSDTLRAGLVHLRDRIQARSTLVSRKFADLIGLELWLRVFFTAESSGMEDFVYARPA
jgi:asparagine synthase (glutamine-hydrolysing)